MRRLLIILLVGTALWSGYWFAGSTALRHEVEAWFARQDAGGMRVEKTALSVMGFPNRFDLRVEGLSLTDPASGIGWQVPFAEVYSMTWKPWHVIAAFPPDQVIRLPDQDIALSASRLRASLRARPATDLPLAAAVVETEGLQARSTLGWRVGAGKTVASLSADEQVPGAGDAENAYVLALDMAELAPDPAMMARFAGGAGLPATIAMIQLRATARLTGPLDRHARDRPPGLVALDLSGALVTWGDLSVTAAGAVAPDDLGYAAGRIEITVTNWERLMPVLVASGAVRPDLAPTVQSMLAALAQQTGDPAILRLPLVLADGRMQLGPLPLGPAPRMVGPTG